MKHAYKSSAVTPEASAFKIRVSFCVARDDRDRHRGIMGIT